MSPRPPSSTTVSHRRGLRAVFTSSTGSSQIAPLGPSCGITTSLSTPVSLAIDCSLVINPMIVVFILLLSSLMLMTVGLPSILHGIVTTRISTHQYAVVGAKSGDALPVNGPLVVHYCCLGLTTRA